MNRVIVLLVLCVVIAFGMIAPSIFQTKISSSRKSPDILGESELPTIPKEQYPNTPTPTPIPGITLDKIFSSDHSWVNTLPNDRTITVIATGDVIPARSVNYKMVTKNSYIWPFEKTRELLNSGDLTVINLETPLMDSCAPTVEGMSFCGSSKSAEGIKWAGIDIATLGNNHIGNHGISGIEETIRILKQHEITPISKGYEIKTVKGVRVAFLSYNDIGSPEDGVPWADKNTIAYDVKSAKKEADIVIVSFHWGIEYQTMPTDHQRDLAHFTIDSGADLILGNHPHWIQPIEFYNGKCIAYAHGNFIFDQEWSEETKLGVVGSYVFFDTHLVDVTYTPIKIIDYGQPYILDSEDASTVMNQFETASRAMSAR